MAVLSTVKAGFDRLSAGLYWLAMLALLAMSVHVFLSVAARSVLGRDLSGTLETTAYYYMPVLAFAALPHLDALGGHIRADLISARLTARADRVLETLACLAMCAFFTGLAVYGTEVAYDRTISAEVARSANGFMPVWPGRWALAAAAALTAVHYLLACLGLLLGTGADTARPGHDGEAA
ncbi:TRAP transporter small permease [Salipiger abyssi]|uniref:TRAP transporter small permease protein n=1 Tax=Salipiger abyssi TaxID=1250539 RepID=A0A1P8UN37_9RHOB|nr:TRAP transporter small permease subunit [Salipiger abyssi]APZ50790.1 TRAP-type C4-dicarboxylate transport system, small permease component [Salipiger abyssi]